MGVGAGGGVGGPGRAATGARQRGGPAPTCARGRVWVLEPGGGPSLSACPLASRSPESELINGTESHQWQGVPPTSLHPSSQPQRRVLGGRVPTSGLPQRPREARRMEGRCDLCPPPPPGGCDGLGGMHDSHGWGAGGLWDLADVRGPGQGLLRPGTSSHPAPACGPLGRAVGGQRGQTWEGPAQPCWGDRVYEVPPPCPSLLPAQAPLQRPWPRQPRGERRTRGGRCAAKPSRVQAPGDRWEGRGAASAPREAGFGAIWLFSFTFFWFCHSSNSEDEKSGKNVLKGSNFGPKKGKDL